MLPARLLVYGKEAALDLRVSQRLTAEHQAYRKAMPQVLARRRPQPREPHSITLLPRVLPREKYQHLSDKAHREIVSEIRPTPPHELLQELKKETIQVSHEVMQKGDDAGEPAHTTVLFRVTSFQ